MNNFDTLLQLVVLFVPMVFIHFVSDWIFQSHADAVRKHDHFWIRTKHCAIYTLFFLLFFLWMGVSLIGVIIASLVLFVSHHIEDTYKIPYLWAKYIRRPVEMQAEVSGELKAFKGFQAFFSTPIGTLLVITIDQIVHITFLWVVAYIILSY